MFKRLLNVTGPQVRTILAIISFHLGIAYAVFSVGTVLETLEVYGYQQSILPLWVFACLFLSLAILTFYTVDKRLTYAGRHVAAFGMSVYILYSLTFIPHVALTALAIYPLLAIIYFLEAFAKE